MAQGLLWEALSLENLGWITPSANRMVLDATSCALPASSRTAQHKEHGEIQPPPDIPTHMLPGLLLPGFFWNACCPCYSSVINSFSKQMIMECQQ